MKTFILSISVFFFGIIQCACQSIVNKIAFHPDNINVLNKEQLPSGIQEFSLVAGNNTTLVNLYLPNASAKNVLIYFHGNGGNIYHRIPSLIRLQKFGLNVVGVSYRGYGKSNGSPSESGMYQDGKAVLRYVVEELGFHMENIILFGRSLGTAAAINTAQFKTLGGLILITPLTSGKAHARVSGLGFASSLAGDSFDNLTKIKHIKTPILIVHGTEDRVVPFFMGEKLYTAATSDKKFVAIEGANHNNLHDIYGSEYWPPISSFLNEIAQ